MKIAWNCVEHEKVGLECALRRLFEDLKAECFEKRIELSESLSTLWDKELENLDDFNCPKIHDLLESNEEMWISDPL